MKIGAVDNSEGDGREDANQHLRDVTCQTEERDLGTAERQETERVVGVMGTVAAGIEVDDPEQVMRAHMEYEEEGEAELLASDPTLENMEEQECVEGWDTVSLGFEPVLGDDADSVDEVVCQRDGRVTRAQTSLAEVVQSPQGLLGEGIGQEKPSDCPPNAWVNQIGAEPEITFDMIREAQLADETIEPILKKREESGDKPPWEEVSMLSAATMAYWRQWEMLSGTQGVLTKRWESNDGKAVRWLIVLPQGLRRRVLDKLHASTMGAHLGREKTLLGRNMFG